MLAIGFLSIGALQAGPARLVTLGGPATEIVYALGVGAQIVATDSSSSFPEEAGKLPQVGYVSSISAEGVMSQRPDLVLATSRVGPTSAVEQLRVAGVKVVVVPNPGDPESLRQSIEQLGQALDREREANRLWERIEGELAEARALVGGKPRVAFLMAGGGGALAAGDGTQGGGVIGLAGGQNVFADLEGYKPVSQEALLARKPEVILIGDHSGNVDIREALGGLGMESLNMPGVTVRVISVADYLAFGPRIGQAAGALARILRESRP
ncbi:MAG: hemin ABC transporter substrate-binding protein [Terrimicrobiaceae bacterium]